jgi:hypothetical protein
MANPNFFIFYYCLPITAYFARFLYYWFAFEVSSGKRRMHGIKGTCKNPKHKIPGRNDREFLAKLSVKESRLSSNLMIALAQQNSSPLKMGKTVACLDGFKTLVVEVTGVEPALAT